MTKQTEKPLPLFISPSAWQTWGKCVLSLQNPRTTFKTDADGYADAGTNLHAHIAACLHTRAFKTEPVGLDPDDAALVRFAVETTISEADGRALQIEYLMNTKKMGVVISGTADAVIASSDTVVIIDHKTGWKEVDAEGNQQLKIYAHLYALKNKNIKRWRGVIINARFNSTSYTSGEIDPKFLSSLAADVTRRTAAGRYATGNHCAYCPRLSICKMLRNEVKKWMAPGAIDSLTREPEKLAEALRLAKPAEKLFDTIKKEAQLYVDLGGVIPGVSVEYSPGTRAWPRDLNVDALAKVIGLDAIDMKEIKIISPAEAERRGASKEAINALAIRPPRKGFKFN
jgi:hypothetical protein